jgi:hypothetical protein
MREFKPAVRGRITFPKAGFMQLIVIGAVMLSNATVSVVEPRPNDTTSQSSLMLAVVREHESS